MQRAFLITLSVLSLGATLMAWYWRSERLVAAERLQRALASRAIATAEPGPVAPTAPAAPAQSERIAVLKKGQAEYQEAMKPSVTEARLTKDPRLAELHTKKLRLELRLKYGPFLRNRNVTAADRERLLATWIQREVDLLDVGAAGREFGLSLLALKGEREAVERRTQETESAVLGSEGAAELLEYRRSQPLRDAVATFHGESVLAGLPLSVEQTDAVAAVLMNSQASGRRVRALNQVDPTIAERLLGGVISPEQIDLLLLPLRDHQARSRLFSAVTSIHPPAESVKAGSAAP